MPLLKIEWTGHQRGWALWHLTEPEDELARLAAPEVCPITILTGSRRLEWLGGRVLLKYLAENSGLSYQGLVKDEFGKPSLDNHLHPISLSHSYPFVAAQLDSEPVGIDIEQPRPKLLRIAPRVFNPVEAEDAGQDLVKNCIYWCAKEALYKIYGLGGISFTRNLKIEPFTLQPHGKLRGNIVLNGNERLITLAYRVEPEFVLVYTENHPR